jgi:hypothetical protein
VQAPPIAAILGRPNFGQAAANLAASIAEPFDPPASAHRSGEHLHIALRSRRSFTRPRGFGLKPLPDPAP